MHVLIDIVLVISSNELSTPFHNSPFLSVVRFVFLRTRRKTDIVFVPGKIASK